MELRCTHLAAKHKNSCSRPRTALCEPGFSADVMCRLGLRITAQVAVKKEEPKEEEPEPVKKGSAFSFGFGSTKASSWGLNCENNSLVRCAALALQRVLVRAALVHRCPHLLESPTRLLRRSRSQRRRSPSRRRRGRASSPSARPARQADTCPLQRLHCAPTWLLSRSCARGTDPHEVVLVIASGWPRRLTPCNSRHLRPF
jgi:hypothetical protein